MPSFQLRSIKKPLIRGLLIVLVIVLLWMGRIAWLVATAPQRPFTIGPETTWIVEPLHEDGYPDYPAAVNGISREGVTTESNAAVGYWQVEGRFGHYNEGVPVELDKELGITLPAEGCLVSITEYLTEMTPPDQTEPDDESLELFHQQYDELARRPWTVDEAPMLSGWIDRNRTALDRLVEASTKDGWYSPLLDSDAVNMLAVLVPAAARIGGDIWPLSIRGMRQVGQGDPEGAWRDFLAVRRLGRLVGQGPLLVHTSAGADCESAAFAGECALVEHAALTLEQARRFQRDLANLPPPSPIAEKLNTGARFTFLSAVTSLARMGPAGLDGNETARESAMNKYHRNMLRSTVDWDHVLRSGNAYFDRLVAAAKIEDRQKRNEAIDALTDEIDLLRQQAGIGFVGVDVALSSQDANAKSVIEGLLPLLFPNARHAFDIQERAEMTARLTHLALALNAYRTENGGYPEDLSELVPRYIEDIPIDVFTGQSPEYTRLAAGYEFVSPGPNGLFEDGPPAMQMFDMGSDDVVVRIPGE